MAPKLSVWGFPGGSVVKNEPANTEDSGDMGSILRWERFPWRSKWQPTPVFLPVSIDRGAWQATVHGDAKSWTKLKRLSLHTRSPHHNNIGIHWLHLLLDNVVDWVLYSH